MLFKKLKFNCLSNGCINTFESCKNSYLFQKLKLKMLKITDVFIPTC